MRKHFYFGNDPLARSNISKKKKNILFHFLIPHLKNRNCQLKVAHLSTLWLCSYD